ncbi:hypothetical protein C9F10_05275, partial [Salmonella enterica subsp. enterica serovar Poona]
MTGLTGIKLFLSVHLHTGNSPEIFFADGQRAGCGRTRGGWRGTLFAAGGDFSAADRRVPGRL